MDNTVTVTEFSENLADYIDRVADRGESFVLMRDGKAIAEIRPVAARMRLGDLPELFRTLPRLSKQEANEFARDTEEARDRLGEKELRDPWDR